MPKCVLENENIDVWKLKSLIISRDDVFFVQSFFLLHQNPKGFTKGEITLKNKMLIQKHKRVHVLQQ